VALGGKAGALLQRVEELEVLARENVSSVLSGNYLTSIRGSGLEFHEARQYQPGDPVRHIDWNMTARTDEPWVRTYLEEREREFFIALDVSASMYTGWQERTKLETAIEAAATLAVSVDRAGDRLGWVLFTDEVVEVVRPGRGGAQLYRFLRRLVRVLEEPPDRHAGSDPRQAIHAIQEMRGRRFAVFLISDFLDHDVPEDIAHIRIRHDVSLLHIYDPFEYAGSGPVRLLAQSPEGPAGTGITTLGHSSDLAEVQQTLTEAAGLRRVLMHSMSCADPVGPSLAAFFHRKGASRQ
jgi:uncharacterized protein (DUF58 family)